MEKTLFQGDILVTKEEKEELTSNLTVKNAIKREEDRWPRGIVPYYIDPEYSTLVIVFIVNSPTVL